MNPYQRHMERARKVRRWIAQHPESTLKQIKAGVGADLRIGMMGYLQRRNLISFTKETTRATAKWSVVPMEVEA